MSDELETPWYVDDYSCIRDDDGRPIADFALYRDAAAIVHRVNCHDKLVKALDRLRLQILNSGGQIHTSDCYIQSFGTCTCGAHGIYQDAKAALELAKGDHP